MPDHALVTARQRVRDLRFAAELSLAALLLLLLIGPLLDWRRGVRSIAGGATLTLAAALLMLGARALLWIAIRRADLATPALTTTGSWAAVPALMLASPIDFALTSLLAVGLVAIAVSTFGAWRAAHRPGLGVLPIDRSSIGLLFVATQLAAGGFVTMVVVAYESFLRMHVAQAPVDILRFAFDPRDEIRMLVAVGLMALNAALVGGAVLVLRLAVSPWAFSDSSRAWRLRAALLWLAPALLLLLPGIVAQAPRVPAGLVLAFITAAAWTVDHYRARLRHTSQAARLFVSFLTLILPSIVLYPSLVDAAQRARQQLVESRYAPEVTNQRRDLQVRLREALIEIDRSRGARRLRARQRPAGRRRARHRNRVSRLVADRASPASA